MTMIWDAKTNFILSHFIHIYQQRQQQQSSSSDIDWLTIVKDISLEICATPNSLKDQYEQLLETFNVKQNSNHLHIILKQMYLNSLCKKLEENSQFALDIVYELVRHARTKRIDIDDIQQLMNQCTADSLSDEERQKKSNVLTILNRIEKYIRTLAHENNSLPNDHLSIIKPQLIIDKPFEDNDLQAVSDDDDDKILKTKQSPQTTVAVEQTMLSVTEQNKFSPTRRRAQSLTLYDNTQKTSEVNIGVEWFVPKLKRQQRSSSLHGHCESSSSLSIDCSSQQNKSVNSAVITTENTDSIDSVNDTELQQVNPHSFISGSTQANEHIVEEEHQQQESKLIDDEQLEQVSSDSELMEVQQSSPQQDHSSYKRQRLS